VGVEGCAQFAAIIDLNDAVRDMASTHLQQRRETKSNIYIAGGRGNGERREEYDEAIAMPLQTPDRVIAW
jgi:hypothetical protein